MNILEDRSEGWAFVCKNRKTGLWRQTKKFHYFKNGVSLCGKYENDKNNYLPNSGLYKNECCKRCLEILKQGGLQCLK